MNREENIAKRLNEHWEESLNYFDRSHILGLFLQGSQNYNLDYENSDVDTKLIVLPTLDEIVLNKKPVSTTHVRANEEHIDFKDIRLMLSTFKKQNLNFIEILFTPYFIMNPTYSEEWEHLRVQREKIAHYSPYNAVKTMKGIAMEKYHAMEHEYPSKIDILKKYGYDPKQVSHLVRVQNFIDSYLADYPYEDCLHPKDKDFIMDIKLGKYSLEEARKIADKYLNLVVSASDDFCNSHNKNDIDTEADNILNEVQYAIVKKALTKEIIP